MEPMSLEETRSINAAYKDLFVKNHVKHLFHANTVRTSLSFLKEGRLISRQEMERRGLDQTPQYSDDADKKFGIYNDLFLDSVDLCYRGGCRNQYGPVLFSFSLDVLDDLEVPIRVTRFNPCNNEHPWTEEMPDEERYFSGPEEYAKNFSYGDFNHHVTIPGYPSLPFDHLNYLLVDVPEALQGTGYDPLKAIRSAAAPANVRVLERTLFKQQEGTDYRKKYEDSYHKLKPEVLKRLFGTEA